jgi:hypothetical protein
VASLLDDARLEFRELNTRSTLLGACTTCPSLRSDLEAAVVEIKDLKHKLNHSSHYTILILMFHLAFTLMLRLALLHVIFLSSLMDLTIAHMVLVHERTSLSLDDLVMTHVLIMVIVSHVGLIFLLEGPTPTLS